MLHNTDLSIHSGAFWVEREGVHCHDGREDQDESPNPRWLHEEEAVILMAGVIASAIYIQLKKPLIKITKTLFINF